MSVVVTGATGQLGRLVVEDLLERGMPANGIVAAGRDTGRIQDLAERGVRVQVIDYAEPATLRRAFEGADRVLLVSSSEVGRRVAHHHNAIEAAATVGVGLLAYTSIANADTTRIVLATDHQATERLVRESGLAYVLLRNSWYLENYTGQVESYLAHGAGLGSAGNGRVSAATRADFASAAAAVLTSDGHEGAAYELGGDTAFTMADLAHEISEATGQEVAYRDVPAEEYTRALVGAGLPEPYAAALADSDLGIARGDLYVGGGDLSRLIGRPTTTMRDAVRGALGALAAAR